MKKTQQETGERLRAGEAQEPVERQPEPPVSLARFGMTSAEFGSALIDEAQKREKVKFIDRGVAEAQRLLSGIDAIQEHIANDTENLAIYRDRIEAIKAGKYKVARPGEARPLIYDEERLNKNC